MCEALRELMKDDIDEAVDKEHMNTTLNYIRKMMKKMKMTAAQAMQVLEIPDSEQSMFASML